jgi:hypothetical protein
MARFAITGCSSETKGRSCFGVVWLDGELHVGESFEVRDAGHHWPVPVAAIERRDGGVALICDFDVAWEDQFAPAIVNTNGPPADRFKFVQRQTIHVALADEGTAVWRPVPALVLTSDTFLVLGEPPNEESWRFPPGTIVRCEQRHFADGTSGLAAKEGIDA